MRTPNIDNTMARSKVGRDPAMHHAFNASHPSVTSYFGGVWYSTPALAMCPEGRRPGDGKVGRFFNFRVRVCAFYNCVCVLLSVKFKVKTHSDPAAVDCFSYYFLKQC